MIRLLRIVNLRHRLGIKTQARPPGRRIYESAPLKFGLIIAMLSLFHFRFIALEEYAIMESYHFTCQGRIVYAADYRDD